MNYKVLYVPLVKVFLIKSCSAVASFYEGLSDICAGFGRIYLGLIKKANMMLQIYYVVIPKQSIY